MYNYGLKRKARSVYSIKIYIAGWKNLLSTFLNQKFVSSTITRHCQNKMFHHRPLQHCLFTMVCVLLSLPPAFWTAWVPPTHTYPTGRLDPTWYQRFGETSCHVHRGVVVKAWICHQLRGASKRSLFGALGLSVLGVWGDGYPLGGELGKLDVWFRFIWW